eukprot:421588-Rhodomonas_salina.1
MLLPDPPMLLPDPPMLLPDPPMLLTEPTLLLIEPPMLLPDHPMLLRVCYAMPGTDLRYAAATGRGAACTVLPMVLRAC